MLNKKIQVHFHRIIELFTQKIVTKLSKIWVWDLGSEIRDPGKTYPDPGVKKAPDPGSGSATLILSYEDQRVRTLDPTFCAMYRNLGNTSFLLSLICFCCGFLFRLVFLLDSLRNVFFSFSVYRSSVRICTWSIISVFRIHDILVWTGSADPCLWLIDPDPDPAFLSLTFKRLTKNSFFHKVFLLITFWRYIYIIF
jgi:hypothetical protein